MKIFPEQEEAYRKAAQRINEQIRFFEQNFPVKDRQDSLAMCAISLAMPLSHEGLTEEYQIEENIEKLKNIYQTLTELSNKDYCLQE